MRAEAAGSRAALLARVENTLRGKGAEVHHRIHVPGRIEVLGKHTDYAGGRSLLAAIERGFCVAVAPRADSDVRLIDAGRVDEVVLSFENAPAAGTPHWAIYPAAVVRRLARDFGLPLRGADISFISDLPPSSGLSSSSALLIATFEALRLVNRLDDRDDFRRALPGVLDVAAYLGSVESGRPFRAFGGEAGVGTSGGSQDHTAILASEALRLSQFGFAPVRAEGSVAIDPDLTFVVGVSGVVAQKTAGAREAYNRAAALSACLLDVWRAHTGRADTTLFEAISSSDGATEDLRRALQLRPGPFPESDLHARLDQFVDETLVLIPAAVEAMRSRDLRGFGAAVLRSQQGAERGLGNQVPETIELARLAVSIGAHAASAFGAGFGGSVWALVSRVDADRFLGEWAREYAGRFHLPASTFFRTNAGPPLLRLAD
jgi:galactokinase